jgi:hypothetical protein
MEVRVAKPQVSVVKRQREAAKRERQQAKAAKREQRKSDKALGVTSADDDIDWASAPGAQE